MKKVIVIFMLLSGALLAQKTDPSFLQFKNNSFGNNFKPVFTSTGIKIQKDFRLSLTKRKPMFCRMEDKLHGKFNVWLQLRAGSDQDYRKLAFPEEVNKKRPKLID